MTIEMNVDYLLKNKITANEFLVLQLILDKRDDRLKEVAAMLGDVFIHVTDNLIIRDFIEATPEGDFIVTKTALDTFKGKGRFEEFRDLYPASVVRPDGKRDTLRIARKTCSTKYNRIAKRQDVHDNIMKCLAYELEERKKNDTMKYMQRMPNWLTAESWKEWEEKMKVSSVLDDLIDDPYGTELI